MWMGTKKGGGGFSVSSCPANMSIARQSFYLRYNRADYRTLWCRNYLDGQELHNCFLQSSNTRCDTCIPGKSSKMYVK